MMKKSAGGFLLLLLHLSVAGCSKGAIEESSHQAPPEVLVERALFFSEPHTIKATGTVIAGKKAILSAPFEGVLEKHLAEPGDAVREKAVLLLLSAGALKEALESMELEKQSAEINLSLALEEQKTNTLAVEAKRMMVERKERSLQSAQEQYRLTEKKLTELMQLAESGAVPMKRVEEEEEALKRAEGVMLNNLSLLNTERLGLSETVPHPETATAALKVSMAEQRIRKTEWEIQRLEKRIRESALCAPFDGVVTAIFREPGERINRLDPLVSLYDPCSLHLSVLLPYEEIISLEPGAPASIGKEAATGKLEKIIPAATGSGGMMEVIISFSPEKKLFPGIRQEVILTAGVPVRGILLPPEVILKEEKGKKGVYVVVDNRCFFREVFISNTLPGRRIITKGIEEGELLCLSIPSPFFEGMEVRVHDRNNLEEAR
jgi:multidrug efflux pump subunit AcrA (membrane-fusion protein)